MEVGKREISFRFFFGKVDVGEMCELFDKMSCHILGVGEKRINKCKLDMYMDFMQNSGTPQNTTIGYSRCSPQIN